MTGREPRVVLVTRPTRYEHLLGRHGTREQARFFLQQRGQSIELLEQQHQVFTQALQLVTTAIPVRWRRSKVARSDLDRFLFEPDDIVLALGQDGLVANLAKYLSGQPVMGINPSPDLYEGVLVPHPPEATADLLSTVAAHREQAEGRAMVEARLDDGQRLLALNEVFVGHASHQSAVYRIGFGGQEERQSSSGVIVATGTGSTGWARSIHRQRRSSLSLPSPTDPALLFFVREAWPSVATGTAITEGVLDRGGELKIVSEMEAQGVVFGDGVEADRMAFGWGCRMTVGVAEERLMLVR